ncbi:S1C family serine protease [Paenibacillus macquariensis]|uniref:Serine protease Do n=1 Tax=Paenibacillus macquariensis TaxID=948756 RepID=A0ABY1KA88_9BACL|nr:trypsin-like peptidase domain-containing protein [Paenibacillus macquariensis]MEC0093735.1 trypsin-like peptidase domain-containing protein [Paenibacillus macquariensis]OAB31680.1 serine protease [Paenibacillus macquariensis subsp. macquariensis]SIR50217.1 serine protease Do [Paenibacillus macquariensis]
MGLFEDEFYSTKVSKQRKEHTKVKPNPVSWSRTRRRGMSTIQISVISSVIGAVVATVLFSLITGLPSSTPHASAVSAVQVKMESDPFERLIQAAAKVRPAVVSIANYKDHKKDDINLEESGLGSGVIFKKENGLAYIITNNHVIAEAEELEVLTIDGDTIKATLVGTDTVNDIAVLSIDGKKINTIAEIGDSSKLRQGETVISLGNPLGLGGSLTSGIVSYTKRLLPVSLNKDGIYDWEQEVIQTDAAINEGNSGGALVDLDGKVIGINTMKISDTGVEGLGFAIPTSQVMKTVNELMLNGKIARPYIGVYTVDLNNTYAPLDADERKSLKLPSDVKEGVVVLDAVGPALEAGLKLNDVITKFDNEPITSTMELRKFLYDQSKIGDELSVTFYREGELKVVTLKISDKPAE